MNGTEYEIMSLFSFTNGLHIIIHKQSAKHPKIDFQEIIIVAKLLKEVSFLVTNKNQESCWVMLYEKYEYYIDISSSNVS